MVDYFNRGWTALNHLSYPGSLRVKTIIKGFRLQKNSNASVLESLKSISFYKSQNKNNLKTKNNYVPASEMGIVSGYILILLARKYNNSNFWPLSISNFNSENYIFVNMRKHNSNKGLDLTLQAYQLENRWHQVHDYFAVYDFRHFINKITR